MIDCKGVLKEEAKRGQVVGLRERREQEQGWPGVVTEVWQLLMMVLSTFEESTGLA